jgi:hypothetical protein
MQMDETMNTSDTDGSIAIGPNRARAMAAAMRVAGGTPEPKLRMMVCPFCGALTPDSGRCGSCAARFDPLSRQASQNQMGPWFVRDEKSAHRPGCNYSTIQRMVESGGITAHSVVRGPSTNQFWMLAKHTPGVAHLLGHCHNCGAAASAEMFACKSCGETFSADRDRQHMGLGPVRAIAGSARGDVLALHASAAPGAERIAGPAISLDGGAAGPRAPGSAATSGGGGADAAGKTRIDELSRAVARLQRAWRRERSRTWISLACAASVTVLAIALVVIG